jgi:hypothetical protein
MVGKSVCRQLLLVQTALLAASVMLIGVGCGKPTGAVSGKVYFKDQPLKGGNVTFISLDGKSSATVRIAEDGSYSVPEIPVGDVRIAVETKSLKPNPQKEMAKSRMPKDAAPEAGDMYGNSSADKYVAIPDKFSDPGTSQLMYTVVAGAQEYKIDLK